jgi:hypothetical protein
LFEFGGTGIDPSFFYSKNLPTTESIDGQSLTYSYILSGTTVKEVTATAPNGNVIMDFYY